MKITGWMVKFEERKLRNRFVEQTMTHPVLLSEKKIRRRRRKRKRKISLRCSIDLLILLAFCEDFGKDSVGACVLFRLYINLDAAS